jgi:hypothetical protein
MTLDALMLCFCRFSDAPVNAEYNFAGSVSPSFIRFCYDYKTAASRDSWKLFMHEFNA